MTIRDEVITLSTYPQVKAGLYSQALARADDIDRDDFCKGNVLENTINSLHGQEHRDRRRAATAIFSKANRWGLEEGEILAACARSLARASDTERLNLIEFTRSISIMNAIRIVGMDVDAQALDEQTELGQLARVFAAGAGVEETKRPRAELLADVQAALERYDSAFFGPAYQARKKRRAEQPDEPATDVLDALVAAADSLQVSYEDMLRETAFYMAAGSDTTTQSTTGVMHFIFESGTSSTAMAADLVKLQLWLHEALRLRTVVPIVRRRATQDVTIADLNILKGTKVLVDLHAGSVDKAFYGPDADRFNPERELAEGVPRFGFAFSGGLHACLGKALAAGAPITPGQQVGDDHLYGVVTRVARELLAAGIVPDQDNQPRGDADSHRWSRWTYYPVLNGAKS
jgi:cytochrome P450